MKTSIQSIIEGCSTAHSCALVFSNIHQSSIMSSLRVMHSIRVSAMILCLWLSAFIQSATAPVCLDTTVARLHCIITVAAGGASTGLYHVRLPITFDDCRECTPCPCVCRCVCVCQWKCTGTAVPLSLGVKGSTIHTRDKYKRKYRWQLAAAALQWPEARQIAAAHTENIMLIYMQKKGRIARGPLALLLCMHTMEADTLHVARITQYYDGLDKRTTHNGGVWSSCAFCLCIHAAGKWNTNIAHQSKSLYAVLDCTLSMLAGWLLLCDASNRNYCSRQHCFDDVWSNKHSCVRVQCFFCSPPLARMNAQNDSSLLQWWTILNYMKHSRKYAKGRINKRFVVTFFIRFFSLCIFLFLIREMCIKYSDRFESTRSHSPLHNIQTDRNVHQTNPIANAIFYIATTAYFMCTRPARSPILWTQAAHLKTIDLKCALIAH